jgi:hypothetical protein
MAKKIPLYPRIELAKNTARDFIVKSGINTLPVDLFAICKKYGWTVKSVSEAEELTDEIDPFSLRFTPECDAKTYLTPKGKYFIVYRDEVVSKRRILWTIAHEIGHIVLKHLEDFEETEIHRGLTEEENEVLEKEADAFASEYLAPSDILLLCNCTTKNFIVKLCGLSNQAAENKEQALKHYKPDKNHEYLNKAIHKQFYNFIHNKEFYHSIYQSVCPCCKNYIFSNRESFCRLCGSGVSPSVLTEGIVYNDGPELNKSGRVLICPKCSNSTFREGDTLCSRCGFSLTNACTNSSAGCNIKLHGGSARYCYGCGSETIFFKTGLLSCWQRANQLISYREFTLRQLEDDSDTGCILKEWDYILNLIKEDSRFDVYSALKGSIAKLDYDTLFIYSESEEFLDLMSYSRFISYIIKLFRSRLKLPVMEVLTLPGDVMSLVAVTED